MANQGQNPLAQSDREKWNRKYRTSPCLYGRAPATFLVENIALLPQRGKALDIAAGEGRNSLYLAQHGYTVDAVDISEVGLEKAQQIAREKDVAIHTIVADLTQSTPAPEEYDLVANFYYLQRDLIGKIKEALKIGGIIIFETYTVEHLEIPGRRLKREYCLEKDELPGFFPQFEILKYRESTDEYRAVAGLIARKRRD